MAIRISKDRVKLDIPLNEAKGADIASASSIDLGAATGNFVDITGTTGITSLGTADAGIRRIVRFNGTLTLTHNATSLILPGNGDITTASGDIAEFVSLGSGNWTCSHYTKDTGEAVVTNGTNILSAQTSDYTLQPGDLAGTLVVPIDISSGSVPITELPLAEMSGIVRYSVVNDAGQSSSNKAEIKADDGTVIAVMFQQNEEYVMAYDGTNRRILSGDRPCPAARAQVAKTADQSVPAATTANALDANTSEKIDQGGNFASGAYTAPWAGRCRIVPVIVSERSRLAPTYSIGGLTQIDWAAADAAISGGGVSPHLEFDVSAGDVVRPQVHCVDNGTAGDLNGDAAEDESLFIIMMIERHR